jgi:hypothetical protein
MVDHNPERDAVASSYRDALRAAVLAALEGHPAGSAVVAEVRTDGYPDIWGIDITPTREGAARASVTLAGDEVILAFGETHAYLWDDNPNELADEVRQVLAAVFAGHFEEAGKRGDSRARVTLEDGGTWRGGSIGLPAPWNVRSVRRYLPLSDTV